MTDPKDRKAVVTDHRMEVALSDALTKLRFVHKMTMVKGVRKGMRHAIHATESSLEVYRHWNRKPGSEMQAQASRQP